MNEKTIDLDNNVKDGKNIPFCLSNTKIVNINKNKKKEQYIIFSTIFQLKLIPKAKTIFMDGTFKCTPKNFYRLFNIKAYLENENFYILIAYILMSNK